MSGKKIGTTNQPSHCSITKVTPGHRRSGFRGVEASVCALVMLVRLYVLNVVFVPSFKLMALQPFRSTTVISPVSESIASSAWNVDRDFVEIPNSLISLSEGLGRIAGPDAEKCLHSSGAGGIKFRNYI